MGPLDAAAGGMIQAILPSAVAAAEAFGHLEEALFPQEEAALARAVDKRRREFRTVRACARAALAQFGVDRAPMVPGPRGAPSWPDDIVGSMTHCEGYAAAAVARPARMHSLGVDAEPHGPLPDGVLDVITLPDERRQLAELRREHPAVHWDRLMFSAKESVYKAWYPLTHRWLDFEGAFVTIHPDSRTLTAELLVDGPLLDGARLRRMPGRWTVGEGVVLTAVTVSVRRDGRDAEPAADWS
ncbi:MAG TPA: 4'-phosphopantetheinyl transferase superfamily protein [Kineosporiaceae bacterium]